MGTRARIWTILLILVGGYLVILNIHRLPEFGSELAKVWPLLCILVGFFILLRRKTHNKDLRFHDANFERRRQDPKLKE
jgi:hypothetical protein